MHACSAHHCCINPSSTICTAPPSHYRLSLPPHIPMTALMTMATTRSAKAAVATPYSEGEIQVVSDCGGFSPLPAKLSPDSLWPRAVSRSKEGGEAVQRVTGKDGEE